MPTGEPLLFLSSLQEVLRPAIVQVLRDPLAATQLGNAVLAAQAFQNDPDLLLGRIVLARRPSDVLNNLLSWFLRCSGLLSQLRSCERYDEPETLPYSVRPFCPMSADGGAAARSGQPHRHHTSLVRTASSLRADMIFRMDNLQRPWPETDRQPNRAPRVSMAKIGVIARSL